MKNRLFISYLLFFLLTAVRCGVLEDPENGAVSLNSVEFGAFAFYFCNTGYNITGEPLRQCLANELWSGEVPTCPRK